MDLTTVLSQNAACSADVLKQVTSPGLYRGAGRDERGRIVGEPGMADQTDQGDQRHKFKDTILVGLGSCWGIGVKLTTYRNQHREGPKRRYRIAL